MTRPPRDLQRRIEKYVLNPGLRLSLRAGLAPSAFALIETTGRRTGRLRTTPVGGRLEGAVFWVVAEHGQRSDWVRNLVALPQVRVRVGRRWRTGVATPLPDDDAWARRDDLDRHNGTIGRVDGQAFRRNATTPLTIRIDLDL